MLIHITIDASLLPLDIDSSPIIIITFDHHHRSSSITIRRIPQHFHRLPSRHHISRFLSSIHVIRDFITITSPDWITLLITRLCRILPHYIADWWQILTQISLHFFIGLDWDNSHIDYWLILFSFQIHIDISWILILLLLRWWHYADDIIIIIIIDTTYW